MVGMAGGPRVGRWWAWPVGPVSADGGRNMQAVHPDRHQR